MKSKYFDFNKFKDPFDPRENDKRSRKQTKPKHNLKTYLPNPNQTDSDFRPQTYSKNTKKPTIPHQKHRKQISKSQKPSPKRYNHIKSELSSNNYQISSNKSIDRKNFGNTQRQSRLLTDNPHQTNFIGQLNNYLKELKRSKLDFISNQEAVENQTLLINKFDLINKQKSFENTLLTTNLWQNQIKKEKSINRNLQKCIIEIQKVLWDRNDKLQILEDQIKKQTRNKQNIIRKSNTKDHHNLSKTIFFNKNYTKKTQPVQKKPNKNIIFHEKDDPLNQVSKIWSRQKKIQALYDTYSDTEKQSDTTFKGNYPRRKTQTQINIEKIIQKTLGNEGLLRKPKRDKSYNRFQRQQLNDV